MKLMRILNGSELVGYIKERQAQQVRSLRQASRIFPQLAIIRTGDSAVTDTYLKLKQNYGRDILVEVTVHHPNSIELLQQIDQLNHDTLIHGMIIQLPLVDPSQTDAAVKAVASTKDVDGLSGKDTFVPATAMAIDWLLAGYNVDLKNKKIAIVGNGRLVGAPLHHLWQAAGHDVTVYDNQTEDLAAHLRQANIIVSATGVPGLITSEMIGDGAVVVDAGTAAEHGRIVGDLADDVRQRQDLTITPIKGGVGPLTVAALFDNVILAARRVANKQDRHDTTV